MPLVIHFLKTLTSLLDFRLFDFYHSMFMVRSETYLPTSVKGQIRSGKALLFLSAGSPYFTAFEGRWLSLRKRLLSHSD